MAEYRRPIVLVGGPPTFITTNDPDEARLAAEVFAAQWRYVHHQASDLELFSYLGLRIAGRMVEVDPFVLDEWARRGEFDLAEAYRELFS